MYMSILILISISFLFCAFVGRFQVQIHYIFIKSNQRCLVLFPSPLRLFLFVNCQHLFGLISAPWLGLFRQLNSYVVFAQFSYTFFSDIYFFLAFVRAAWWGFNGGGIEDCWFNAFVKWPVVGVADKFLSIWDWYWYWKIRIYMKRTQKC